MVEAEEVEVVVDVEADEVEGDGANVVIDEAVGVKEEGVPEVVVEADEVEVDVVLIVEVEPEGVEGNGIIVEWLKQKGGYKWNLR